MTIPIATYRVQFNRDFRFRDALDILDYLRSLGISHLYASPVFMARAGSTHGYDVIDPTRLNPELGTEDDFQALVSGLHQRRMGLILDIVPNHMAASAENPWWMDVLENGAGSSYASYFDIEWEPVQPGSSERLLLPILGQPYGAALESGELRISFENGRFCLRYYETRLPLDPKTYPLVLGSGAPPQLGSDFGQPLPQDRGSLEPEGGPLEELAAAFDRLPARTVTDWEMIVSRDREKAALENRLCEAASQDPAIRTRIDQALAAVNGIPGDPSSFDRLHELLEAQPWVLAYYRVAREKMNYRRFFDITELVGVAVENMGVFEKTHALVAGLVRDGSVSGLRIDHVDGLLNPREYVFRLDDWLGHQAPVWVEKILLGDERLPREWPVCGTTGYDFLAAVNALFVDTPGWHEIGRLYTRVTGITATLEDVIYRKKLGTIDALFAGEFQALALHLAMLADRDRKARDESPRALAEALRQITACLLVYRTYVDVPHVTPRDLPCLEMAISEARRRAPEIPESAFEFSRRVLLLEFPRAFQPQDMQTWLRFVMRWQQLTGPIMAKGVEDTTYYVHNRFLALNEVGGNPTDFSAEAFHRFSGFRAESWPDSMNATSTHDTKRSEDVRARLDVLSEIPAEWSRAVIRWTRWNRPRKRIVKGLPAPDSNDEFGLYQALVGAWPFEDGKLDDFRERVRQYARKAAREAKEHTSWLKVDAEYEEALLGFVDAILEDRPDNDFLRHIARFQRRVAFYGAVNSLSQVLLKCTAPGFPDFYQGTELWDLSLVDPDNRRPVDYRRTRQALESLPQPPDLDGLLEHWQNGRIKMFVTQRALEFRTAHADLFRG